MKEYIIKRLLHLIPIIFGITFISFFIIQLSPGDYYSKLLLNPEIKRETIEEMKRQFGLDKPLIIQYFKWLWGVIRFDFGYSFAYHIPVSVLIKQRLWNTLILSISSLLLIWLVAVPLGVFCAVKKNTIFDKVVQIFAFLGMSLPTFFIAFLLVFFAATTGILPIGGTVSHNYDELTFFGKILDRILHLIIPVFVLTITSLGGLMRITRGNMIEVLLSLYITVARAKGLSQNTILFRHALKNAINPMITIFGFQLSGLLSGAALTEIITRWPGLGRLILDALLAQDLYLVMASLTISSILLIIGNLIADILLALSDPRIRYQ